MRDSSILEDKFFEGYDLGVKHGMTTACEIIESLISEKMKDKVAPWIYTSDIDEIVSAIKNKVEEF